MMVRTTPEPSRDRTIVLFMVDQLAARWLEQAREGIVDLPNFDALQRNGVTFEHAFTGNPVCSPSRASIITGMSSAAHGVGECGYDLDPEVPTFARALQDDGWRTGAFGKLHYITQLETLSPQYEQYGYDVVFNTEDARAGEWVDWVKDCHPEHYEAALSTVWMTMAPDLLEYGPNRENLRDRILAAQQKFPESTQNAYELPFPAEVSQTAWITDRALHFIREGAGDLFAHISYVQPHNPFTPPAEYVDRVDVDAIPEPAPAAWRSDPIPYYQQARYGTLTYDEVDWRRERQLYFADLAHLDHELGLVLDALRETGRAQNTLFIFTSDHGEMLHDQGLLGKWERHYDPCIRIPMIVTAPGAQPGVRDELIEHTDIAATAYEWAGVAPPELPVWQLGNPDPPGQSMLHGTSMLPSVIDGAPRTRREAILVQSNNSHFEASPRSWARTVRTDRYRFTRHLGGGGEQLFDLIEDPDEQHDRARDPAFAEVRTELLGQLAELTAADAFPTSPRGAFQLGSW